MSSLWINPFPLVFFLVLLPIILPLAGFAVITSFIAIVALITLAACVYAKLGINLVIRTLLTTRPSSSSIIRSTTPYSEPNQKRTSPTHPVLVPSERRRRLSSASSTSPVAPTFPQRTGSFASLIGFDQPNRDYEGVGGWRDSGDSSEDAQWTRINSRLELPAAAAAAAAVSSASATLMPPLSASTSSASASAAAARRHRRSLTAGSQRNHTWYGGQMGMTLQAGNGGSLLPSENRSVAASAAQSRNRTPSGGSKEDLGYFGQTHGVGRRRSVMGMIGIKKMGSQASMDGK
jgi:hypothetical protein